MSARAPGLYGLVILDPADFVNVKREGLEHAADMHEIDERARFEFERVCVESEPG